MVKEARGNYVYILYFAIWTDIPVAITGHQILDNKSAVGQWQWAHMTHFT